MRPSAAEAIVTVMVNYEPKGEFVVLLAQDGDILMKQSDFQQLGLSITRFGTTLLEGAPYVSLRSVEGMKSEFDQAKLELRIQVQAQALARRQVFDLSPRRARQVIYPSPGGAFLNYNATALGNDPGGLNSEILAGELGVRLGDYLLLTDGIVNQDRTVGKTTSARLSTSLLRDDRESLQRLVLGDFVTAPNTLGSSLRLGGVSFSKRYSLDPYFLRFPGQIVSGTATLPSEVFVYSNGVLVQRQRVAPGAFELQNFLNLNGLQATEVVIRDVLGNEQRIANPFYFTDSLLKQGLDEYGLDAGLERRRFGVRSNDYGKPALSGFYRRGVNDDLTLGLRGESLEGRYNLGPTGAWRAGIFGITSAALAYGQSGGSGGSAYFLSHSYQSSRFNTSVALRGEAQNYPRAASDSSGPTKHDFAASLALPLGRASSLGLIHTHTIPWTGVFNRSTSLSLHHSVSRDALLSASVARSTGALSANQLLLTLYYSFDAFGQRSTLAAQTRRDGDVNTQTLQFSGANLEGEGLSYRATAEHTSAPTGNRDTLNPFLQYNFRNFVARGEYFHDSGTGTGNYQLGVLGAVAYVGGVWGASRPIFDSFAVAKVGDVPDVRVYANNQEIGRTGQSGTVFIPRLASYFDNPISVEDRDLPIRYIVPEVRRVVSPAFRSGTLVDFKARRVQAVAGRLFKQGGAVAFGEAEGEVEAAARKLKLFTSRDGRFYIEDLAPGDYSGRAIRGTEVCVFRLRVPQSIEVVTDLGEVSCGEER